MLRLSFPMIWAMLALISVQLVDAYFISMLGERELVGIGFTFPVTTLISHLIFGINVAMSSVVARLIGERRTGDVRRVILHGLIFAFLVSCVVSLICYLALDEIFAALGADENVLPVIRQYMPLWLLGSAFLAIPVNANSAVRASGDTLSPSLVMISISLVNLVLAPVLIFGWLGFPAWGVFGAACATLVAYLFGLFFALYFLIVKKNLMALDGLHLDKFMDSLKRLVVIAAPASAGNIITPAATALITALLARHGPEAVAAFGIVSRIEAFSMIAVIALALGMAPLVGQNWGAKKYERVNEAIRLAMAYNFAWSLFAALILGMFARPIASLFSGQTEIVDYAVIYFWLVPVTYGFGNLVFGWGSAFNAIGMPQRSFFMIVVKAALLSAAALAGGYYYGATGIFLAIALTNIASGAFFHLDSVRACLRMEHPAAEPASAK